MTIAGTGLLCGILSQVVPPAQAHGQLCVCVAIKAMKEEGTWMLHDMPQLQKQLVDIGDRVVIRSSRRELTVFAGKPATVVAVFDAPRGSCVVRLDAQPDQPELFLYSAEVATRFTR